MGSLHAADGHRLVAVKVISPELAAASAFKPQLMVLDIMLPDIDGFEVAARLTANGSAPAVVLTSSRDVGDLGPLGESAQVRGFIPKSELSGAALEALL